MYFDRLTENKLDTFRSNIDPDNRIKLLLSNTKMKSVIGLFVVLAQLTACTGSSGTLPADFPADVPIISGEIYSARRTTFEDGKGFAVSVLTTLSYEEVFAFYADVVGPRENGYVLVETTRGNTATRYVSIAVHLTGNHLPHSGFVELIEVDRVDQ